MNAILWLQITSWRENNFLCLFALKWIKILFTEQIISMLNNNFKTETQTNEVLTVFSANCWPSIIPIGSADVYIDVVYFAEGDCI